MKNNRFTRSVLVLAALALTGNSVLAGSYQYKVVVPGFQGPEAPVSPPPPVVTPPAPGAVALTTSAQQLNFGSVAVGATAQRSWTVSNTGTAATSNLVVSLSGGAFTRVGAPCAAVLAPGASCDVTVRFSPSAQGNYTETVSASANGALAQATLNGAAVVPLAPVLSVNPTSINFGAKAVGASTDPTEVVLSNTGNTAATFTGISISSGVSDFGQTNTCDSQLAAGAECSISVSMTPAAAGTRNGVLSIMASNAPTLHVALSGTASSASATLEAPDFPNLTEVGTTSSALAVLTNTGSVSVDVTAPSAASVSGNMFSFVSADCPTTLAPGSSCNVVVRFSPTASGDQGGSVAVSTSSGPKTVSFTATASQAVGELSGNGAFGTVMANTTASRTFTYINSGNAPARNVVANVSHARMSLSANTCGTAASPGTVNAGMSCSVTVTYAPNAVATVSGTPLQLVSSAANSPHSVTLTGTATADTSYNIGGKIYVFAGGAKATYDVAANRCATGTYRGTTGWRIATKAELDTLASNAGGSAGLAGRSWPSTTTDSYWSSTAYNASYNHTKVLANGGNGTGSKTVQSYWAACTK